MAKVLLPTPDACLSGPQSLTRQAPRVQNSLALREGSQSSNSPRPRPVNHSTEALAPARVTMTTGQAR